MINLSLVKDIAVKGLSRSGLLIQKFSPEVLIVVGVVGVVAATVVACVATKKLDEVQEDAKKDLEEASEKVKADPEGNTYTDVMYRRDVTVAHTQRVIAVARLYAPAALIGMLSISCLLGSHYILSKRNAGLMAAYKAVDEAFKKYRKNVVDEYGPEKDYELRFKQPKQEETLDKDGKAIVTKKSEDVNPCFGSMYAKWWDDSSCEFQRNYDMNFFFLKTVQNFMNEKLRLHGHLFLNEVYDALGIPRTQEGAVVGWVLKGNGDDFVDLSIFNPANDVNRDTINGYSCPFLIDPNVDGIIWNLI